MKVYIETYGCTANRNDSEIMMGILRKKGHEIVLSPDNADAIIINTCIVKHTTEEKIKFRINFLKNKYPNKRIIISGCMVTGELESVKNFNLPIIGPRSLDKISDIAEGKSNYEIHGWTEKPLLPMKSTYPIWIIQLSEGCLGKCTYCITRFARGKLKSYKPKSIIKSVRTAISKGFKEIWLTSQDNSSYGLDIGTNLAELLKEILKIDGDYKIRIGMMNPMFLKNSSNLIDIFKDERIFKFVHIPVQSGSNKILKLMKRGYTVEEFEHIVKSFRKNPNMTIWTDIIVGFPTETEEEFQMSVELLKRIKPDYVNVSRYSNRPGTEAKKMKQVPTEIKKERSRIMSKLVNQIAFEKNKKWINWNGKILIDEYNEKKKNFIGRNFAYKPVILDNNSNHKISLGSKINVKIVDSASTYLKGILIDD